MSWIDLCNEAYDNFSTIKPSDLVVALRHRFDAERISRHFKTPDYEFSGAQIKVDAKSSVLMEFPTLRAQFPDLYNKTSYKLLLILNRNNHGIISRENQLELDTVLRKDNIDKILLWTCEKYTDADLHNLKSDGIDIFSLSRSDALKVSSISHYLPVEGRDHAYALSVNLAADLLFRRLKKMFHLVLSEVAAPIYNALYAKQKIATDETMKYEEKIVDDSISRFVPVDNRSVAVDVGCGTGRHTFPMSNKFGTVYAFDFSPLMIDEAQKEKERQDITNVLFSVADMEYENVRDEGNFLRNGIGNVGLIVASFGLGSFIEDTTAMMRRFHGWLAENGILIISFYNQNTILNELTPNWRDTSLAAHLEIESSTLRVELSKETVFHIYCKPYSEEIKDIIIDGFDIKQIYRFPTLMALLPNELLQNIKARGMFRFVDEILSEHKEYQFGHYVTVVAVKRSSDADQAHARVLSVLDNSKCQYEIIEHPPVVSSVEALRFVTVEDGLAVKTLFMRKVENRRLVAYVTLASRRVDMKALADQFGTRRLYFGSDRDVLAAGFPLGGVSPIGAKEEVLEQVLLDVKIAESDAKWIYTGSGDNRRTLKVALNDFLRVMELETRVPPTPL